LNINTQINEGLATLRILVNELRGTREPSGESLATSLDVIVRSIAIAQGKLTSISEYRAIMFNFYNIRLDINQVRDFGISKQSLMSLFIDLRMDKNHLSTRNAFVWPSVSNRNLMITRWIGGSRYLINFLAITWRCLYSL
jgi:hypothetical protein